MRSYREKNRAAEVTSQGQDHTEEEAKLTASSLAHGACGGWFVCPLWDRGMPGGLGDPTFAYVCEGVAGVQGQWVAVCARGDLPGCGGCAQQNETARSGSSSPSCRSWDVLGLCHWWASEWSCGLGLSCPMTPSFADQAAAHIMWVNLTNPLLKFYTPYILCFCSSGQPTLLRFLMGAREAGCPGQVIKHMQSQALEVSWVQPQVGGGSPWTCYLHTCNKSQDLLKELRV